MHTRTRPLFALLVLILASLACSSEAPQASITKGRVTCNAIGGVPEDRLLWVRLEYSCFCGDSAETTLKRGTVYNDSAEQLESQVCGNIALTDGESIQPTEPPTEELAPAEPPTEEPAPTDPPAEPTPVKPFLTGAFTTCNNVAGYVNFTIADDAPAYDPATFKVTFNNYPVSCAPAANNPKVFTCKYPPASYAPPAGVQVIIGEELVNEFDFNAGPICDPAPQPNNPNPTEDPNNTNPAAPTEDPGGSG